jgi:hypothetical protein
MSICVYANVPQKGTGNALACVISVAARRRQRAAKTFIAGHGLR